MTTEMKKTILIVEHEPDILNLKSKFLKLGDFDTITCRNAKEAMKVIQERYDKIDLILLDIMMSGRSGYSVLEEVKNNEIYNHIPVVLFSTKLYKENLFSGGVPSLNISKPCSGKENLDDIIDNINWKLFKAKLRVKAWVIVSTEGLPIVSYLPEGINERRIAAMTLGLFSLGVRSIMELGRGDMDEVFIKCSGGQLLVMPFWDYGSLVLSTEDRFKGVERNVLNVLSRLGPFKPPGSSAAASTIEEDIE